ncbi:putative Glycoprotein [Cryptosporidium tyzzeri]|nr:putative Glycoprotein [Cryptosporidium tyzzeri]
MGGDNSPPEWCYLGEDGQCDGRGGTYVDVIGNEGRIGNGMAMTMIPNNDKDVKFELRMKNKGTVATFNCKGGVSELLFSGSSTRFTTPSISGYNRCAVIIGLSGDRIHVSPFGSKNLSLGSLPMSPNSSFNEIYCIPEYARYGAIHSGYSPSPQVVSTPISQGVTNVDNSLSLPSTTTTTSTTTTSTTTTTTAPPKLIVEAEKYVIVPSIQSATASISFSISNSLLSSSSLTVTLSDVDYLTLAKVKFKSCCLELTSDNEDHFDKMTYNAEMKGSSTLNLTLAWTKAFIYLILVSSMTVLATVPRFANLNTPANAVLENNSGAELTTTWRYSSEFEVPKLSSCNLINYDSSCKSASVSIISPVEWKPDVSFLRYGFISPISSNYPISFSLTSSGTLFASINFSQTGISISIPSSSQTASMSYIKTPNPGDWVSGDIFLLSPKFFNILDRTESTKTCTIIKSTCTVPSSWSSIKSSELIARYAILSKLILDSGIEESEEQPKLYVTYKGVYALSINVPSKELNGATVQDSPTYQPLVYWRVYKGLSPSISFPSDEVSKVIQNVTNPVTTTTTPFTTTTTKSTSSGSWMDSFLSWF